MKCKICGAKLPDEAAFCHVCGAAVPAHESSSPQEEILPPPPISPPPEVDEPPVPPLPPPIAEDIVGGALHDAWDALNRRPGLVIGSALLYGFLNFIVWGFFQALIASDEHGASGFVAMIGWAFSAIMNSGLLYTMLRIVRGENPPIEVLFAGFPKTLSILLAGLLVGLAIFLGFLLFLIPGVIIALGFSMYRLLIMDREAGGIEAIEASWRMMRGYKLQYFLLVLATIGINLLGFLCLGIGLIVTIPLTTAAKAAFYNRIHAVNPPQLEENW